MHCASKKNGKEFHKKDTRIISRHHNVIQLIYIPISICQNKPRKFLQKFGVCSDFEPQLTELQSEALVIASLHAEST